jgi:tryptophan 2,3-dioxygenase
MTQPTKAEKAISYSSYLRIDELLELQMPESNEHDEMLFIIIHQVYELWFKQLIHELDYLQKLFQASDFARIQHTFKRMLTILKTVVAQIDVLETMTPLEFNSFRDRLGTASGFQSFQFRELEFMLGHKRESIFQHYPEGSRGRTRLEQRFFAPTIWDAFLHFLKSQGYEVPPRLLERDPKESVVVSNDLQSILIDIYRNNAALAEVCERLLDFDEGMQEWRYRHVKMVERTIGRKIGTGGSSGVDYLKTTLRPLFPDLWDIRSQL